MFFDGWPQVLTRAAWEKTTGVTTGEGLKRLPR